jgi:outer membrane lipoprotein-sorting protein
MATGLAMARRSIFSAAGFASAGFAILIATPVLAQSVPIPSPRPSAAAASRAPVATGSTPAVMAQAQQAQAPAPATNPFAAVLGKTTSPGALTPQQRAIIDRVSNYLSSIQVMTGQFVQVGPDGRRSEGEIYIQKPGKLRFEYDPPSPIEIISDGGSVVVRDRKLATQDVYPLSQTPLRFLLADRLDLLKDTNLTAVYADDVFITVVVEETHGIVGKSRMMIMFGAKDTQLKQWTVTDPQGYDTTVAVYNLDFTKRPDPNLFRIDYTQYKN